MVLLQFSYHDGGGGVGDVGAQEPPGVSDCKVVELDWCEA